MAGESDNAPFTASALMKDDLFRDPSSDILA